MPYKHKDKLIPKTKDKRVKLTEQDRLEILDMKGYISQRQLAKLYDVSRRTISFIWYPERLERNKTLRDERGGSKQYYDKDKHREYVKRHRKHKEKLNKEGVLIDKE